MDQRLRKSADLLRTLKETIAFESTGKNLPAQALFNGFNQKEWKYLLHDEQSKGQDDATNITANTSTEELTNENVSSEHLQIADETIDTDDLTSLNRVASQVASYMAAVFRQEEELCLDGGLQPDALFNLRNEMAAQSAELLARLLRGEGEWHATEQFRRAQLERIKIGLPFYLKARSNE